jgi:hypothetical protein
MKVDKYIKEIAGDIFEIRNVPLDVQNNKTFQQAFMKIYKDKIKVIDDLKTNNRSNPYASLYVEEETEIMEDLDEYIDSKDLKLLVKLNKI